MLISLFSWWYGKGLGWRAGKILDGIERSMNTFSLGLLVRTWFAPFRQIDAGGAQGGSLDVQLRRAFDKLFSRFIGAFLRTIVMFVGVFWITARAVWGILGLVLWIMMPILPIVFVVIFTTGWTPKIASNLREIFSKKASDSSKTQTVNSSRKGGILNWGGFDER